METGERDAGVGELIKQKMERKEKKGQGMKWRTGLREQDWEYRRSIKEREREREHRTHLHLV